MNELGEEILKRLTEDKLTLNEIYEEFGASEDELDESIRVLLNLKYIGETED